METAICWILLLIPLCTLLPRTYADCTEDLAKDSGFQECESSYKSYLQNVDASGTNAENNTQPNLLMCSKEAQAAVECMVVFVKDCPDLSSKPNMSIFKQFDSMASLERMCGLNTGPCAASEQQCFKSEDFDGIDPATPFNMYQEQIKLICGPLKQQFECVKGLEDKCPDLAKQMEAKLAEGRSLDSVENPWPEFSVLKDFTRIDCPNLPEDFTTNQCVKESLNTTDYMDCLNNSKKENTTKCQNYKETFKCAEEALQKCGDTYTAGYRTVTNFFLSALDKNCRLETSGSSPLPLSFAAIFSVILIIVLHLF